MSQPALRNRNPKEAQKLPWANLGYHCQRLAVLETAVIANGLRRAELYNLQAEELPEIRRAIATHNLAVSVHTPLVHPEWYPSPPTLAYLCDPDEELRELNLRLIAQTLEQALELGADYVVAHYPSPGTPQSTGRSLPELRDIAWASLARLAELSERHQMPLHIEGFGPSPFLTPEFLREALAAYPRFRYCFDTGHMNLAAQRDGFDLYDFAQSLGGHIGSLHLWNTRHLADYQQHRHIPIHPSQDPAQGWTDIRRVLDIASSLSPYLVLESWPRYPEALGGYDYREGIQWLKQLLAT
ncbi:MAG: sugar phosphate isomerase/epimerase [Chloroflexi bacterium]|nr:sugar phosphate isomerase/epimerase [Chloroflexota bacterium]